MEKKLDSLMLEKFYNEEVKAYFDEPFCQLNSDFKEALATSVDFAIYRDENKPIKTKHKIITSTSLNDFNNQLEKCDWEVVEATFNSSSVVVDRTMKTRYSVMVKKLCWDTKEK